MHVSIYITATTLTDGSETYDVVVAPLLKSDGIIRLPAGTLTDADAFAVALQELITKHTVAEVTYDDPGLFGTF